MKLYLNAYKKTTTPDFGCYMLKILHGFSLFFPDSHSELSHNFHRFVISCIMFDHIRHERWLSATSLSALPILCKTLTVFVSPQLLKHTVNCYPLQTIHFCLATTWLILFNFSHNCFSSKNVCQKKPQKFDFVFGT